MRHITASFAPLALLICAACGPTSTKVAVSGTPANVTPPQEPSEYVVAAQYPAGTVTCEGVLGADPNTQITIAYTLTVKADGSREAELVLDDHTQTPPRTGDFTLEYTMKDLTLPATFADDAEKQRLTGRYWDALFGTVRVPGDHTLQASCHLGVTKPWLDFFVADTGVNHHVPCTTR